MLAGKTHAPNTRVTVSDIFKRLSALAHEFFFWDVAVWRDHAPVIKRFHEFTVAEANNDERKSENKNDVEDYMS